MQIAQENVCKWRYLLVEAITLPCRGTFHNIRSVGMNVVGRGEVVCETSYRRTAAASLSFPSFLLSPLDLGVVRVDGRGGSSRRVGCKPRRTDRIGCGSNIVPVCDRSLSRLLEKWLSRYAGFHDGRVWTVQHAPLQLHPSAGSRITLGRRSRRKSVAVTLEESNSSFYFRYLPHQRRGVCFERSRKTLDNDMFRFVDRSTPLAWAL